MASLVPVTSCLNGLDATCLVASLYKQNLTHLQFTKINQRFQTKIIQIFASPSFLVFRHCVPFVDLYARHLSPFTLAAVEFVWRGLSCVDRTTWRLSHLPYCQVWASPRRCEREVKFENIKWTTYLMYCSIVNESSESNKTFASCWRKDTFPRRILALLIVSQKEELRKFRLCEH